MKQGLRHELRCLLRDLAYQRGQFNLSSNRESQFYVDAKQVTMHPRGINLVGEAFFDIIRKYEKVQAVGGLTLGADPIATAVAGYSDRAGRSIPQFVVRKNAKKHGLQRWIEGHLPADASVAVVEDVITSGQSVLDAVERVEQEGCHVEVVIALVDRREGGAEEIRRRGYQYEYIFTIDDIASDPVDTDNRPQTARA